MGDFEQSWYRRRTSRWQDWPARDLIELKQRQGTRISVVIPARNEERTVAGVVGAAGVGLPFQLAAFGVASAAGLVLVRPIAMRHIKQPPALRTGTAALVGRSAIVMEEVNEHSGRVRIEGEEWSSRPYLDESLVIPVGTKVDVMQIKGATALVYPRE